MPHLRAYATTHPGLVHPKNEDSHAVVALPDGATLVAVCDGMGGMGRGDQASALAISEIVRSVRDAGPADEAAPEAAPSERLSRAITAADDEVRRQLCGNGQGWAGSTAVLVYIRDGRANVAWVGDSRAYLVRDGVVVERTKDHKLIQELIDSGQITPEEAKRSTLSSVITRALGGRPLEAPALVSSEIAPPWEIQAGDRVVLCSDGMCDLVTDEELPVILANRTLATAAEELVITALDRGGHDNTTVIVLAWDDLEESDEPARRAPPVPPPAAHPTPRPASHRTPPAPPVRASPSPPNPDADTRALLQLVGVLASLLLLGLGTWAVLQIF